MNFSLIQTGKMLYSYFFSSILTLSLTYSWYSFYGVRFVLKSTFPEKENNGEKRPRLKPIPAVPVYMWDIFNNGVNSSEVDVVKGIHPIYIGSSFNSRLFRNHRRKQLQFSIPKAKEEEVLMNAELRITTNSLKNLTTCFQIYVKSDRWIFLDEKKVSGVEMTWISLQVSPTHKIWKPGTVVTFLILTLFQNWEENSCKIDFLHPVLLLSYFSRDEPGKNVLRREKRNLGLEDYEEKTNRIWGEDITPREVSKMPARARNSCRRKSLYIKFSEIDYDSWIVAPTGYDAFQCVGKCTFPVGEHLSPTKHAILQTLLHSTYPWKTSRACCVPTRLDPISILYIDENGVLTYRFRYPDMVVAECGCR